MKDKIKGLLTRKKLFRFFKIGVIVVLTTIALFSLLGTVAHASGLVDDTVNADNLYSQYPLENYQLDFYVDNSWGWLPWNWLDGIGKSVQYGLYCITKRDNTSFGSRAGSAVGAVLDTKNKVKDKATAVKENIKDMPTQTAYALHSAKEKAKENVSDFKRGIVQGQETRQSQRADKLQQHRQNIADKRMELQKAQEAKQAGRTTDGSATTGATRPHDRPVTSSPALKADTGKMQEIKRPVTTDKVHTEPTTPQSVKERPLASGTEKRTSEPVSQPQRQTVKQTNKTERTLSSQQKQTNYQKNQQTVKKTTTKKGHRK